MNVIEIVKKENVGKRYEITIDNENIGIWEFKETHRTNEFEFYQNGRSLSGSYYTSLIARMEFKEVIDWSKVPVDTKVLVSNDGKEWSRRHFAEYKDGKVYCFNSGVTSFTVKESYFLNEKVSWEYVKLYQE